MCFTESNGSKLEGQQSELEKKAVSSKVKKIFRLPGFKCAVVVAERLLASNIFHQEQATFMSPAVNQGIIILKTKHKSVSLEVKTFYICVTDLLKLDDNTFYKHSTVAIY